MFLFVSMLVGCLFVVVCMFVDVCLALTHSHTLTHSMLTALGAISAVLLGSAANQQYFRDELQGLAVLEVSE